MVESLLQYETNRTEGHDVMSVTDVCLSVSLIPRMDYKENKPPVLEYDEKQPIDFDGKVHKTGKGIDKYHPPDLVINKLVRVFVFVLF